MTVAKTLLAPVKALLGSAWLYELQQRLTAENLNPLRRAISHELEECPPDSVLDFCCGPGNLADCAKGRYLGLDNNPSYIERAKVRFGGDSTKQFVEADALAHVLPEKSFHTTLFVDALHHFDDDGARHIIDVIRKATRTRVVVSDLAPETSRPVARLLISADQGRFVRPKHKQVALLEANGLNVLKEYTLYSGFAHLRLMICSPSS